MKTFKQHLTENYASAFSKAKHIAHYIKDQRQQNSFVEALDVFEKAYEAKILYNSQFGDHYSYGYSRGLEKAYDSLWHKFRDQVKGKIDQQDEYDFWGMNPQNINKLYKLTKKYESVIPTEFHAFMEAVKDMPAAIKELKTYIVKGRIPKPVDPNAFVKPMAPYEAQKMAQKFLQEAVDSFKKEYEASVRKSIMSDFERIKDKTEPEDFKKMTSSEKGLAGMIFMRDGYNLNAKFKLKEDYQRRLENVINDTVENTIGHFVAKNTSKLALIFAKKPDISEHKILRTRIHQGMLENDMHFAFPDNSSFTITSQVIYKYTQDGKLFVQYPTRFTNVIMADGSRMSGPSEEKMIKEF